MRTVGIKVLKNRLSEYIRAAAAGEIVQVTDRGRVVAEIAPPSKAAHGADADARWRELIRRGIVTPARVTSGEPLPRKPVMSFEELMADLDASREDR